MRKNMKKYKKYFSEEPWIFNKIDVKWLNQIAIKDKADGIFKSEELDYGKFKWNISQFSIRLSKNYGLDISDEYRTKHNKKIYMALDKRDGHMIRYLMNYGFYKVRFNPTCKQCREVNSRKHETCRKFDELRENT